MNLKKSGKRERELIQRNAEKKEKREKDKI